MYSSPLDSFSIHYNTGTYGTAVILMPPPLFKPKRWVDIRDPTQAFDQVVWLTMHQDDPKT